jgi:hypothetical protein
MQHIIRRLEMIEGDARRREDAQDQREETQQQRHEENTVRLYKVERDTIERFAKIEKLLTAASVYINLGRWTMNLLMVIGGGVAVALMTKWMAKP